jgi:MFS family permease
VREKRQDKRGGAASAAQAAGTVSGGRRGARAVRSPLWHKPDFLKLWAGQSVSLMGSSVTSLAIPLTAIYTLHAGAEQIGVLKTLQWLPYLLVSLLVGAWSDRHRRRRVMIGVNVAQALVMGTIVTLGVTRLLTLPILYVAVFAAGTLTVFFDLSYSAYVPAVAGRDLLVPANSRLQASASVAQIAGPGLGGLLVELVTAPVALIADAASFVFSAASLLWIRDREPAPRPHPGEAGVLSQVRIGLVVVLKNPLLRALVGTSAFFNLFSQWMAVLLILFAVRDLGLHPGTIGLVTGSAAVGALAGSFLAGPASRRFGIGVSVMGSVVGECVVLLAVPFAPASHPALAAVLIAAVLAASGLGSALSSIVGTSVRQAVTPQHLIGRMTATYRFVSFGVIALGALCGGFFGQWLGLRGGLLVGAIGMQSTIVWMALSALPRVHDLPAPPEAAGEKEPAGEAAAGEMDAAGEDVAIPAGRLVPAPESASAPD